MNEQIETPDNIQSLLEQKEYCKIMKNSKGYTWDLKVFINSKDIEPLKRLDEINQMLMQSYGSLL